MLQATNIDLYYGASHALRDVSISAAVGQVTCVLGRNGVGKTSLLRALFGLSRARSGTVTHVGNDRSGPAPSARIRCARCKNIVPNGVSRASPRCRSNSRSPSSSSGFPICWLSDGCAT